MSADDALPWTTSRCNRLLRPLSSKLSKLRKELDRPHSPGGEARNASSAFATKGSPAKTTNFTRPAHKPRGFDKARDPDWQPGAKPGASKRTYGGRGGRRVTALHRGKSDPSDVSRPGEIAMTPFLARRGLELHSSPLVQASPLKRLGKHRGPLTASVDQFVAPRMAADIQKLVQGMSEAYANLLQATTIGGEKRWRGTRSLMGACLRRVPAYIELEEHFAEMDKLHDAEDADDREVANEVYEHLESRFEQRAGQGWRPFRQVVRAHGTALLCNAITDGILELQTLALLVTHCVNVSAWDEGERLLLAFVSRLDSLPFPVGIRADLFDYHRQPYLSMVKTFVDRTGRLRLLYDILEHMIALELLPLEWLATECMRPIWDRLVRTFSDHDVRTFFNAYRFMETASLASMGLSDDRLLQSAGPNFAARRLVPSSRDELRTALNTTISSLLTILVSVALANGSRIDTTGQADSQRINRILDAILVALATRNDLKVETKLLNLEKENAQIFSQRMMWTIFAALILRLETCKEDEGIVAIDKSCIMRVIQGTTGWYMFKNTDLASTIATLPSLVSSIARGTGRIWHDDGLDQLQRLIAALISTSGCRLPHKLWTFKRLALEATMEFAGSTGDPEHMAYFRKVEDQMRTEGKIVINYSPQKNDSPTVSGGFRWEEGIGEWVTCTPFAKQTVKRQPRQPIRVLDLLPTPEQSVAEDSGFLPSVEIDNWFPIDDSGLVWDGEDDDTPQQSSPIKKAQCIPAWPSPQRIRAPSPLVRIPARRSQEMSSDSTHITFYPDLPEERAVVDGKRRSVRMKRELKALSSQSRTQRSRSSIGSGLRLVKRPLYTELNIEDGRDEADTATSGSSEDETDATSVSVTSARGRSVSRVITTLGKRTRGSLATIGLSGDEPEQDELGRTPGRPRVPKRRRRRRSSEQPVEKPNSWWKVKGNVIDDSEASEDELSFH
ncbi:hypothetical protein ACN47E_008781 [Coniothyrium glycines]